MIDYSVPELILGCAAGVIVLAGFIFGVIGILVTIAEWEYRESRNRVKYDVRENHDRE